MPSSRPTANFGPLSKGQPYSLHFDQILGVVGKPGRVSSGV